MRTSIFTLVAVVTLLSCCISSFSYQVEKNYRPSATQTDGTTLYVGGDGPGNYSRIQDAIDNASDGDTVFVYNGTYHENLRIEISINLIGEDRNTTIIDGNESILSIDIDSDRVTVQDFTIQNRGISVRTNDTKIANNRFLDAGILYHSYPHGPFKLSGNRVEGNLFEGMGGILLMSTINSVVSNNTIILNGIVLSDCEDSILSNNTVENSGLFGIEVRGSFKTKIINNTVRNSEYTGIFLNEFNRNCIITGNLLDNNDHGMDLRLSHHNMIVDNTFKNSDWGVYLQASPFNSVATNNFIDNEVNARFYFLSIGNKWDGNYWDGPQEAPYRIRGGIFLFIPWFNFDWNPADSPY